MVIRQFWLNSIFAAIALFSANAYAQSSANGLVYHGRVLRPDGSPLQDSNVSFNIKIYARNLGQGKRCLIWEETQSKNMQGSLGAFELNLGESANKVFPSTSVVLSTLMRNTSTNEMTANCSGSVVTDFKVDSYARDREMEVTMTTSAGEVISLPAQNLKATPFAMQAFEVGGYSADSLAKLSAGPVNGQALILPRLTTGEMGAIASPLAGYQVFNTDTDSVHVYDGTGWVDMASIASGGTVTSVALSLPSELTVAGSPVTISGILSATWANQNANLIFAGPSSGGAATPGFRALAPTDIPDLDWAKITSGKPTTLSGYGITDQVVLNAGGTPSFLTDTFANRPAFGTAGRIFIASDTRQIFRDNGTAWEALGVTTVTSADITDGTIADADVSATAAIARTKLASGTADHVLINDGSGVMSSEAQLSVTRGGTGLNALGTANQIFGVNNAGTAGEYKTVTGTANQVVVTHGANSITLSGPQDLNTTSTPTFATPTAAGHAVIKSYADGKLLGQTLPATPGAGQNGQVLKWDNGSSAWIFANDVDNDTTYTAGDALTLTGNDFDVAVDGSTLEINTDALRVKDDGITSAKIANDSIVDADIKSDADIARSKIKEGTANHVLINDTNGDLSSEALLNVARGGTGVDGSTVTDGQFLIGHDANNNFSLGTLTGTSNRVSVTNGAGSITLSGPQDIHSGATPQFAGLAIGGAKSQTSALVELISTTQGFLLPRMTTAQRTAIASPTDGLQVYDTDLKTVYFWENDGSPEWKAFGIAGAGLTSVGLSLPSELSVTGSPLTANGSISAAWANQNANLVFAGPASGGAATPAFRSLAAADIAGTITGTANQVVVTNGATVALSLPQDIASTSTPTFATPTAAGHAVIKSYADANLVGKPLAAPLLAQDQKILKWDNTAGTWIYADDANTVYSEGTDIDLTGAGNDVINVISSTIKANDRIVKSNGSGAVEVGAITTDAAILKGSTSGAVTLTSPIAPTSYTLTMPGTVGSANQVLGNSGTAGLLTWIDALTSATGFINGGNTFGGAATLGTNDNFALNFETNDTTRMTILNDGKVGIGTATPAFLLQVTEPSTGNGVISVGNSDGNSNFGGSLNFLSSWASLANPSDIAASMVGVPDNTSGGRLLLMTSTTGGTLTERMRIDSAGNIGIGSSNPQERLRVSGSNTGITIEDTDWAHFKLFADSDGSDWRTAIVQSGADGALQFRVGQGATGIDGSSDSKLFITNAGAVGVGTTSPVAKFEVANSAADTYSPTLFGAGQGYTMVLRSASNNIGDYSSIRFKDFNSGARESFFGVVENASGYGDFFFKGYNGTAYQEYMRIDSSGNVGVGTTSPSARLDVTAGANDEAILSTGHSLTGANAQSLIDLSGTWNTTGTPTLIKTNVTDTASNAASLLLDLQVNGVSEFKVDKDGKIYGDASTLSNVTATAMKFNGITAADNTNSINNADFAQTWAWNTIGAGTGLTITSNATGFTGTLNEISLTGNSAGNTGTLQKISVSGASSAATPLMITNLGTGNSFRVNDETGDTDTTPFVIDAVGRVGIGTASPAGVLSVQIPSGEKSIVNGTGMNASMNDGLGWLNPGNGQMYFGDTNNGNRITFNSTGGATLSGNWFFEPTLDLVGTGPSANDVRWRITKTGDGAGQTITAMTQTYASNVAGPNLVIGANGIDLAIRDNSTWSEPIDSVALSVQPGTGNIGIATTSPAGKLHVGAAPTATANYPLFALGNAPFDGSTAGYFTGHASGTVLGANAVSGYAGDLINMQIAGVTKFKVDKDGVLTAGGITATSIPLSGITAATSSPAAIDNLNFAQAWNWSTLSTQTAMSTAANAITSGKVREIASSSTAFTGVMDDITLSGDNAANTGTLQKLSVTGASSAAVPMMITNLGTGASFRVNDETGDTDTTPFLIDNSGTVGIGGIVNPSAKLNVVHSANSDTGIALYNGTNGTNAAATVELMSATTSGYLSVYPTSHTSYGTHHADRTVLWGWTNSEGINLVAAGATGNLKFFSGGYAAGNERMIVASSGNIGIATTSPAGKLHVGAAPTATANYPLFALGNAPFDGSTAGYFTGHASGTVLGANAASGYAGDLINMQIAGVTKFKVDKDGVLTAGGITATSIPLSGITAATSSPAAIDNLNFAQAWNWSSLSTQTAMSTAANAITSGKVREITSSSTAFTGVMDDITLSGNNAANTGVLRKTTISGASSAAVGTMITNLGTAASFLVNDETGDTDTTPFVIDADGKVGIGTSSPGIQTAAGRSYLTIKGTTGAGILELATSAADANSTRLGGIQFVDVNSTSTTTKANAFIGSSTDGTTANKRGGTIEFSTKADGADGMTERMRISASGNVGIGNSNPTAGKLEITSASTDDIPAVKIDGGGDSAGEYPLYVLGRSSSFVGDAVRIATNRVSNSGYNLINTVVDEDGTPAYPFIVRGDGNVGIGTASPTDKLDVEGGAALLPAPESGTSTEDADLANNQYVFYTENTGNKLWVKAKDSNGDVITKELTSTAGDDLGNHTATTNIQLGTNWLSGDGAAEGIRIDTNGYVSIGTASATSLFTVAGDISLTNAANRTIQIPTSPSPRILTIKSSNGTGGSDANGGNLQLFGGTSDGGGVSLGGDVIISGGSDADPTKHGDVILAHNGTSDIGKVGIGNSAPSDLLSVYTTKTPTSTATPNSINLGATYSNTAAANLKIKLYDDSTYTAGFGISSTRMDYSIANSIWSHVFSQGTTELMRIKGDGFVGIGTTTPDSRLNIGGNVSQASWTTTGPGFVVDAATYTDTSTAASSTIPFRAANSILAPTFAHTNANMTLSKAATLYIESPVNGTNTNLVGFDPYAIYSTGRIFVDGPQTSLSMSNSGGTKWNIGPNANDFFLTNPSGNYLSVMNATGKFAIGKFAPLNPSYNLSFPGYEAQTIGVERNYVSDDPTPALANGGSLTLVAGGATSGTTNRPGGDVVISSGIATGTGSSKIEFKTAAAGGAGTDDRTPATAMTILGSGYVGIGETNPTERLEVNGNIKITGQLIMGVAADTDVTVSFSGTSLIRTTHSGSCGNLTVSGTSTGGTYTITMPSVTATCTLPGTIDGLTVKPPAGYSSGTGVTGVVYSLINDGSNVWISYVPF